MWTLFEVFLVPGALGGELLTQETLDDTQAQVMTPEEAAKVGFQGIPERPGTQRQLIVCKHSTAGRIQNALEASAQVGQFQVHHVDS